MKGIQIWMGDVKLVLCADGTILYLQNPKYHQKNL
jgi:hypothetical protein